ncbi:MAG: phosphate ABC transporter ATP-binding protein, partial [Candidatus Cloacimonadota bacterium]|nr:phosphate ABC transporter ATP-binding protein [Candidatus Cloacimonadota bacterium]
MAQKNKMEVKNLNLWYDESQALINVNMSIREKKVTAIIG